MQGYGNGSFRWKDESDETAELGVFVDEMSELMSDNEPELVLVHEVEQGRVDVHDMWLSLVLC